MARDYSKYDKMTKQQVIDELEVLKKTKLGLFWDKEKEPENVVINCKKHIPVLSENKTNAIFTDKDQPTHIMIEGDNYHALSVLYYTHQNKIDIIYIDPPYNTGKANEWKYNDKWIDENDAYRHSKWLNMMEKRLILAKKLLKDDGVIFISIDDNEMANLKLLCDEIFGEENFIESFIWHKKNSAKGVPPKNMVVNIHENILCYSKNKMAQLLGEPRIDQTFSNPDNDPRGPWRRSNIKSTIENENNKFIIIDPKTGNKFTNFWAFSQESLKKMISENRIIFPKNKDGLPKQKEFLNEFSNPRIPIMSYLGLFHSQDTKEKIIDNILKNKSFIYRKPINLIKKIIEQGSKKEKTIILDFFAGSGTTGHAVMELNEEDGGNRQFILCTNNENNIASEVCYPRIEKVMKTGYADVKPLGGNLKYLKADEKDFVKTDGMDHITDDNRKELTEKAGFMIGLKENTLEEVELNDFYQIFTNMNKTKKTAIYFQENKQQFEELIKKIENDSVELYIFSYYKIDNEVYAYLPSNINVQDIPEPILTIYKEINLGK
ncbi:MAG: site-specific DNA-methyltransferase [Alphaproteobacteria bacterium]